MSSITLHLWGEQIPGARSPRGLYFVPGRLIFVGPPCRTWYLWNVGTPLPACRASHPTHNQPSTLLRLPEWYYPAAMFCPYLQCLFVFDATAPSEPGSPHSRGFSITHNGAPQSVGLLWTSDQLVAETSTWQHTTLTTDKHPCHRWDSNPKSQESCGRIPTP